MLVLCLVVPAILSLLRALRVGLEDPAILEDRLGGSDLLGTSRLRGMGKRMERNSLRSSAVRAETALMRSFIVIAFAIAGIAEIADISDCY